MELTGGELRTRAMDSKEVERGPSEMDGAPAWRQIWDRRD